MGRSLWTAARADRPPDQAHTRIGIGHEQRCPIPTAVRAQSAPSALRCGQSAPSGLRCGQRVPSRRAVPGCALRIASYEWLAVGVPRCQVTAVVSAPVIGQPISPSGVGGHRRREPSPSVVLRAVCAVRVCAVRVVWPVGVPRCQVTGVAPAPVIGQPISPSGAGDRLGGHFREIARKRLPKVRVITDGEIGRAWLRESGGRGCVDRAGVAAWIDVAWSRGSGGCGCADLTDVAAWIGRT